MSEEPPADFGEQFLRWFRERTEAGWVHHQARSLSNASFGGSDWQQGTRWDGGVSAEEIERCERRWSLRFPPDYRLFLQHLHVPDTPQVGYRYGDRGQRIWTATPSFPDWRAGDEALHWGFDWPLSGLLFDVEQSDLWLPGWGERPASAEGRAGRLRELIAGAPRLIPLLGHRYFLAWPCQAGNPIFSIHQADIILYGRNPREYLLTEFADVLGVEYSRERATSGPLMLALEEIPFWGELYAWNNYWAGDQ